MNCCSSPRNSVALEFDEPSESEFDEPSQGHVDQKLYVHVLKQLLGEEMRKLIHEELASVLAPNGAHPKLPSATEVEGEVSDIDLDFEMNKHTSYLEDGIKELATSEELTRTHRGRGASSRWPTLTSARQRLGRWRAAFGTVTAQIEDSCLRRFVESRWWNGVVNLVVLLNCAIMAFSADQQVKNADFVESTDDIFFWLDMGLLTFYSLELLLRLAVYGRFFFYDVNWRSNYLDGILLFTSLWSVVFTLIASVQQLHRNYTWLRLFRLLRLLRTLRVIRLASNFKTLRAILSSLWDSFWTLIWSIAMLSLMFFMFSLIFVSRVAGHIHRDRTGWEVGDYDTLLVYFGSVARAMLSLFMATTGGFDWGEVYFALEPADLLDASLFLFFIFFIQIALMNIILGVFVEHAMKNMQPDTEQKAHELALEQEHLENELRKVCCKTDSDNSGRISVLEWERAMQDGKVHELLDLLEFPRRHANKFFSMMSHRSESGDSYVNVDDFVKGCLKLRGSASSFDMNAVLLEVKDTRDKVMNEVKMLRGLVRPHYQRRSRSDSSMG